MNIFLFEHETYAYRDETDDIRVATGNHSGCSVVRSVIVKTNQHKIKNQINFIEYIYLVTHFFDYIMQREYENTKQIRLCICYYIADYEYIFDRSILPNERRHISI